MRKKKKRKKKTQAENLPHMPDGPRSSHQSLGSCTALPIIPTLPANVILPRLLLARSFSCLTRKQFPKSFLMPVHCLCFRGSRDAPVSMHKWPYRTCGGVAYKTAIRVPSKSASQSSRVDLAAKQDEESVNSITSVNMVFTSRKINKETKNDKSTLARSLARTVDWKPIKTVRSD